MKQKLLFSLLLVSSYVFGQDAKFEVLPFMNGVTSVKDGLMELGPELNWDYYKTVTRNGISSDEKTGALTLRPSVRLPLTNKSDNLVQIDRFTSTWRGVLAIQYTKDNTESTGNIKRHAWAGQFEYGLSDFKFYPTGNKQEEEKVNRSSYAFELKYIGFFSKGAANASQFSPQFRVRYSHDWKAANEVGVVNPVNGNGIITTNNMVIDGPGVKPTFSPAFSLQYYPGKGGFSYSPTIYYDFTGEKGMSDPFGNLNRLRLEGWIFFYPLIKDNPNVKLGVSPFLSIRTVGTDDFNTVEYGGMITVKFGTTFLQFF